MSKRALIAVADGNEDIECVTLIDVLRRAEVEVVVASVQDQLRRIASLQDDIDQLDRRLASMVKQNQHMQALQAIPGIGPLTATALVSTATDLSSFDSGRQFAAWLGLTPRQTGTGGKTRQLGISKRGDPYVRTMLMHGARAVIARNQRSGWNEGCYCAAHTAWWSRHWPTSWPEQSGQSWSNARPLTR